MNVEDIVRSGLNEVAGEAAPIPDLYSSAFRRGRRRRMTRRIATAGGVSLTVAAIVGAGAIMANGTGGSGSHKLHPLGQGAGVQHVVADPWWDTWTTDRYYGGITPAYLAAARPTYDVAAGPEKIDVYAAGTTPDGTQWAMFTDQSTPHVMQWLQGWDNNPDFGESSGQVTPDATWTSWTIPTRASHDGSPNLEEWLIVVGRPGTTGIDYSADGVTWHPMDLQHGIGLKKLTTPTGFPPAAAKVRLTDASGVYATGAPASAGANADPADSQTSSDGSVSNPNQPIATPTSVSLTRSAGR
jgi:hypothetical protein